MFADLDNNNKDDDFLDDFRQKLGNQSMDNFEEKKNEINRSKNVFIGAVSGIALAAVVGWFVLSPRYANDPNAEIPVVRRPQTAVKVQPTEPGGMEILNQDKSVYDIIEKKDNTGTVVENLLPPPEEPQLPVIAAQQAPTTPAAQPDMTVVDQVIAEQQPSATEQKAAEIIKVAEAPVAKAVTNTEAETQAPTIAEAAATMPAPQTEPQPKVEPVAPVAPKPEMIKIPAAPAGGEHPAAAGSWQVQLISSPNKAAVTSSWANMLKKYPVLKGMPYEIETADLGAKGTFYRLKAGAFADRSGADRLCNDLKAMGGSCIVKKK